MMLNILLISLIFVVSEADPRTVSLHKHLLRNYHRDIRPVINSTTTVEVVFRFFIFNILDMVRSFCDI